MSDIPSKHARITVERPVRAEDACERCHGSGWRIYSSGSTWAGGMGTASSARDVCDLCWGSGDATRHWADLRVMRDTESARVHQRAVELLAEAAGVRYATCAAGVEAIAALLEQWSRKRSTDEWHGQLAVSLAKTLRGGLR